MTTNYEGLSEEELASLIQELQALLATRRGHITKLRLHEMLNPDSPNFMGTGMTLKDFMLAGEIERIQRSFERQSREERHRRLEIAIRMAVEYDQVRRNTIQNGAFARQAIEDVITGDTSSLRIDLDLLSFIGEGDWCKPYVEAYAKFRELIQEALGTCRALETEQKSPLH